MLCWDNASYVYHSVGTLHFCVWLDWCVTGCAVLGLLQRLGGRAKWAMACDFQQCGILTSEDSDKPVQPPFKLTNSKWCSISSLTIIEYPSDWQRIWSDCTYAQVDLRLCWSHIPHYWKSHVTAHMWKTYKILIFSAHGGPSHSCAE